MDGYGGQSWLPVLQLIFLEVSICWSLCSWKRFQKVKTNDGSLAFDWLCEQHFEITLNWEESKKLIYSCMGLEWMLGLDVITFWVASSPTLKKWKWSFDYVLIAHISGEMKTWDFVWYFLVKAGRSMIFLHFRKLKPLGISQSLIWTKSVKALSIYPGATWSVCFGPELSFRTEMWVSIWKDVALTGNKLSQAAEEMPGTLKLASF